MPHLHEIRAEIRAGHGSVRTRYARKLRDITGRNVIFYYSGWLQKPGAPGVEINDLDMSAFMSVFRKLNRKNGLDLILHTPGGDAAATEALGNYLRAMVGTDIRVIVPQLAMSAGTMIACAAKSILMGKHSSLGPIDPQIQGLPAHGIVQEFKRAHEEIKADSAKIHVWGPIVSKYIPSLVGQCEQWIEWSEDMAREWLTTGMLADLPKEEAKKKAGKIVQKLTAMDMTKSHSRHLSADRCRKIGMTVEMMEGKKNHELQDAVLSLHHACMLTLMETDAAKIIENHHGTGVMQKVVRRNQ